MTRDTLTRTTLTRTMCFCLLCWLATPHLFAFGGTLAPTASATSSACDTPRILLPNDALRHTAGLVGETHCYRLDLPAPGLLHLDVSVAGWKSARTRWRLFDADGADAAPETLERWAGEHLALMDAGTWYLEIAAEDPRLALPAYRLRSRFVEPLGGRDSLPSKEGENEGELEPDPEGMTIGGCFTAKDGENEGELEPDPEGMTFRTCMPRQALCDRAGRDDHGDTFACATAFSGRVDGELGNDWGDDADVFRFRLFTWQTVEVVSDVDVDANAALYDRTGQRLCGSGSEGDGSRLVRTLGPGVYYVRVEEVRARGAYTLTVRGLDD